MKVDFKVTAWETVNVPDEMSDKVLAAIKSGEVTNSTELCEKFDLHNNYEGVLCESTEQIPVSPYSGTTIEVTETGISLYSNN
jgi:hypothetical protein